MQVNHHIFMARCLQLARQGQGKVAPNPMVGAVVVLDNRIIGEGYHQLYGEAHAEVNAINSVEDHSLLPESTIYVNLEPCAHFGKTPPCANLIIEKKIKKVVIGCIDPYAEVAGKGIKKLKDAGIDVILDIMKAECLEINKRFFKFHEKKRPYIILKWAQTFNGFIDIDRKEEQKGIYWITQPDTKSLVHKWRAEEAGILVGRKTIENDDSALTCRAYSGTNPIRIVIDKNAKIAVNNYQISKDNTPTFILTNEKLGTYQNITWIKISPFTIESILATLYDLEIQSIIVEGGRKTLQSFINEDAWDEARVLTGIGSFQEGVQAPELKGTTQKEFMFGKDKVTIIQR